MLAIQPAAPLAPSEFSMYADMARMLCESGLLPQQVNTPAKAVAIILAGRELGIQPWQALSSINVISGKPTISPQLMLALIERSGLLQAITVTDDGQTCTVVMQRRGRAAHTETFSMADASAMQLAGKDNWRKQAKIMRRWRCVAAAARVIFPDVILGLYTPEEMGAEVSISDDGDMRVIEAPAPAPAPAPTPVVVAPEPPASAPVVIAPEPPAPVEPEPVSEAAAAFDAIPAAIPAAETRGLTKADAIRLEKYWLTQRGLTRADVLKALGVDAYSKFAGDDTAANLRIGAWLETQLTAPAAVAGK